MYPSSTGKNYHDFVSVIKFSPRRDVPTSTPPVYLLEPGSAVADKPARRIFGPPLGVTPFEFCRNFRHQKTRVHGLSCDVVCVILRLAVLVEDRLMTDGRMDGQTDTTTANSRAR